MESFYPLINHLDEISLVIGWIASIVIFKTKIESQTKHLREEIDEISSRIDRLEREFRRKISEMEVEYRKKGSDLESKILNDGKNLETKLETKIDMNEKSCRESAKDISVLEFQYSVASEEIYRQRNFSTQLNDIVSKLSSEMSLIKGHLKFQ